MAGKLTCVNIETTQASSVVAPSVVGPDAGWLDADATGGTVNGFKYRKLPTGEVMIQLFGAASGTLPVGYRAAQGAGQWTTISCGVDATDTPQWFKVTSDGVCSSSSGNWSSGLGAGHGTYMPGA